MNRIQTVRTARFMTPDRTKSKAANCRTLKKQLSLSSESLAKQDFPTANMESEPSIPDKTVAIVSIIPLSIFCIFISFRVKSIRIQPAIWSMRVVLSA